MLRQRLVFAFIGGSLYDAARHRPFVDSQLQHHQEMKANEPDQQSGDYEHVQREKSGEGCARDDRPTQHQLYHEGADDWNAAGDGRSDSQSPVGILIEAQHLSSEGHSQSHQ